MKSINLRFIEYLILGKASLIFGILSDILGREMLGFLNETEILPVSLWEKRITNPTAEITTIDNLNKGRPRDKRRLFNILNFGRFTILEIGFLKWAVSKLNFKSI